MLDIVCSNGFVIFSIELFCSWFDIIAIKIIKKKKKKPIKRKPVLSPLESSPSFEKNNSEEITNKDVYSLNDLTFDMILQKGNNYKWLVILYSQTCGHCQDARRAIRKVFPIIEIVQQLDLLKLKLQEIQ